MADLLDNFKITSWYKAVIAVAIPCLIGTVIAQRDTVALISCGVLAVALGEWANHRKAVEMRPYGGQWAKVTDMERKTTFWGLLLQVAGFVILFYGLARAFDVDVRALVSRLLDFMNSFTKKQ